MRRRGRRRYTNSWIELAGDFTGELEPPPPRYFPRSYYPDYYPPPPRQPTLGKRIRGARRTYRELQGLGRDVRELGGSMQRAGESAHETAKLLHESGKGLYGAGKGIYERWQANRLRPASEPEARRQAGIKKMQDELRPAREGGRVRRRR